MTINRSQSTPQSSRSSRTFRPESNPEFDFESSESGGVDPRLTIDGSADDGTAHTSASSDLTDTVLVGEGSEFEGEESSDLRNGVGTDLVGPNVAETAWRGPHRTGHDLIIRPVPEPPLLSTNTVVTLQAYGVLSKHHRVELGATVAEYYENYRPMIPAAHWEAIGDFVRSCAIDADPVELDMANRVIGTVSRLVHWAWQRGYELDRKAIFERFTIEEFVAVGYPPTWSEATRRNARAQLFSVGCTLIGADAHIPRMIPIGGDRPSKPYDANERAALRSWAKGQATPRRRRDASVLLATAIGAGLKVEDLYFMRRRDIVQIDGCVILNVAGKNPREVTVLAEWEDLLLESVTDLSPDSFIFTEGRKAGSTRSKNSVTTFLSATSGDIRPNSQRMRATWMVHHLTMGTPIKLLFKAAGVASAHALARFTQFVPEVNDDLARRQLRGM